MPERYIMNFSNSVINELSEKYRLQEWIIKDTIEEVVSLSLTKKLGFEVGVMFMGSSLDIWTFDDIEAKQISLTGIQTSVAEEIKHNITSALLKRSVLEDYDRFKDKIRTVVYGTIIKYHSSGAILVETDSISDRVIAICPMSSQTPKERGHYRVGDVLPFYITNIEPVYEKETPKLEIRLSRNSRGLPEGLIKNELIDSNREAKVRCIKRIAGAFSEIKSSERIPKKCVKKISDELKERIIVRW